MNRLANISLAGAILMALTSIAGAEPLAEFRDLFTAERLNQLLDESVGDDADTDPAALPNYQIFGGTIIIGVLDKDGNLTRKVIELQIPPEFEDAQAYYLRRQAQRPTSPKKLQPSYVPEAGGITTFAMPISKSPCGQNGNGPVLSVGTESGYAIQWCERKVVNTSPFEALKNYLYRYANGSTQLVLTILYECSVASDRNAMPQNVEDVVCIQN